MSGRRANAIVSAGAICAMVVGGHVAHAQALVEIADVCVCNFYIPGVGNRSKVFVGFEYPHRLPEDLLALVVYNEHGIVKVLNQQPLNSQNWNGFLRHEVGFGLPPLTWYMAFGPTPFASGAYAVAAIDRLGNVVIRGDTLTDRSATFIPQINGIDYQKFSPAHGATDVTLTPTLTWDIVPEAGYHYATRVYEGLYPACQESNTCDNVLFDNIFDNGSGMDKQELTVPPGVLAPNTTYTWYVEACDAGTASEINNCAHLLPFAFTTGDGF